jgi:hypothetical protein
MNSVFTAKVVSSASSSKDCVVKTDSYSTKSASKAVSISKSGSFSLDTSAAFKTTTNTVSVVVGSQTKESSSFSAEVVEWPACFLL